MNLQMESILDVLGNLIILFKMRKLGFFLIVLSAAICIYASTYTIQCVPCPPNVKCPPCIDPDRWRYFVVSGSMFVAGVCLLYFSFLRTRGSVRDGKLTP